MYACSSSGSLAVVSRFIGSGMVKGMGAALGVGMGWMCDVGTGFEGNVLKSKLEVAKLQHLCYLQSIWMRSALL